MSADTIANPSTKTSKPCLMVLASTYPRWRNDPEPGFVHELCRRLTSEFSVVALVPDAPDADSSGMFDGVEVIRYRYAPKRLQTLVNHGGINTNLRRFRWKWLLVPCFFVGQFLAARRISRTRPVDLIHAHWVVPQGLIARFVGAQFKIPYVVTSHGGDVFGLRGRMLQALKKKVAGSCAAMTVVSDALRKEVLDQGLRPPVLHVLPMGVNLRQVFVPADPAVRRHGQLLFVGRLVPGKGLEVLLSAMPAILKQCAEAHLLVVGAGPLLPALKRQAQDLGIQGCVSFGGALSHDALAACYQQASVFVAPFTTEQGFGLTLVEAAACGCPILTTDIGASKNVLEQLGGGMLVQKSNADVLARAALQYLAAPPDQATLAKLRDNALERFDWDAIATKHASLLLGLARRDAHRAQ